MQPSQHDQWADVERRIRDLASGSVSVSADAIGNAVDLIKFAKARYWAPESVARGYWPTVCLGWPLARPMPIEIEISDSLYELYRFGEGRTEIQHVEHVPGEPFPDKLAAVLDQSIRFEPDGQR